MFGLGSEMSVPLMDLRAEFAHLNSQGCLCLCWVSGVCSCMGSKEYVCALGPVESVWC